MYAGLAPQDALALYAVIAYMDSVAGVYHPRGGMHAAARGDGRPRPYATASRSATARPSTAVERTGARASAVLTADGERVPADVVVLNPDLPVAYRDLLGIEPWNVRRLRHSPSCLLLLFGSTAAYAGAAHHNLHFGRSWRTVFRELIDEGRLMSDPACW